MDTSLHQYIYIHKFPLTEMVLLKIHNDMSTSVDIGKAIAFTLFDTSAVFGTIGHATLFDCVNDCFSVNDTVDVDKFWSHKQKIIFFNSFFFNFTFSHLVSHKVLSLAASFYSLPQSPSQVISGFNDNHHLYVNTQIYSKFSSGVMDVKLKLNPAKTQVLYHSRESVILILPVPFPQNFLSLSEEVKKLGKTYDLENSLSYHKS